MAQNMHIQQHPVIQTELPSGNSGELGLHFVDLTGCQKTAAPQIDAKDRLCIPERQVCLMQNSAVSADGQDHICALKAFLLRQIDHTSGTASRTQFFAHQNSRAMRQQNLCRTQRDLIGRSFAGVRRNIDRHTGSSFCI